MDEDYWGSNNEHQFGVIGGFAWSEEKASELAEEYYRNANFLKYYKEKYEN